jgi:exodeoxyribonuclease V
MTIVLTQEQLDAVSKITSSRKPELSLAGPAGTGKTTLLKAIREAYMPILSCDEPYDDIFPDVEVCTPTNKAAQVLRKKGIPANTIYKIFFVPEIIENKNAQGKVVSKWLKFTPCNEYTGGSLPAGKRTFAPVIIIDEASMLQTWLVAKLRRMCDRLILIGDPHQLPPVKDKLRPEGYFNTLVHDAELVTIHRQAEGSPILDLATAIRNESPKVVSHVNSFRPDITFEEAVEQGYQVIAFTNKERQRINTIVRRLLGKACVLPEPGDRMISTDNSSDTILNGTTLTCLEFYDWEFDEENGRYPFNARMRYELDDGTVGDSIIAMDKFLNDQLVSVTKNYPVAERAADAASGLHLTYAYCMTAHKAQGSEYEKVAVIDQRNVIRLMTNAAIARGENSLTGEETARRWLYTAVTRAQKELVVAGQWWAVLELSEEIAA